MTQPHIRLATWTSVLLTGVLVSASFMRHVRSDRPAPHTATASVDGDEIVVVFIGASFCGATRTPGLPEVIERMKRSLGEASTREHKRFVTVGVALDWAPEEGVKFLEHFGRFDELHAGRNWLNGEAVDYIWRGVPGAPALPQVVVIERHVTQEKSGIVLTDDHLVRRIVGVDQIRTWVNSNTPLP